VIGVVPDFHFGSLHTQIQPLVMSYPRTQLQDVYVRFRAEDMRSVVSSIADDWRTVAPELPFEYTLMSEHLAGLYRSEQFFNLLFRFFAVIAILVACLGLYGVIRQDVAFRVKEIGIRKVMGADPGRIVLLVLSPVLRLVVAANLVAWPLTGFVMTGWLNGFAYREALDWKIFPVGAFLTLTAAIATTIYQAYSASNRNPVASLRSE
jgi:putative ABC transport system permease protein